MTKVFWVSACAAAVSIGVSLAGVSYSTPTQGAEPTLKQPSYTSAQAERGAAIYAANCQECHGANLDDGEFAAPLKGPAFHQHWGAGGLDGPYNVMATQMPPTNPGSLPAQSYADVLAYVLSRNDVPAGSTELPPDSATLATMASPH